MKMGRRVMLIAVIAIMAMAASIITAQAEECMISTPATEAMGPGMGQQIIRDLNLTPAQVTQLNSIRSDFMNATVTQRGRLNTQLNEFNALMASNASTTDQLKAKADQIDLTRTEIRNIGIDYLARARGVLTPDQVVKLNQMIKDNPGWLFGMACTMGMQTFKGAGTGAGHACPAVPARGPEALAPACPKVCEQAAPATVGCGPCVVQQQPVVVTACPGPCGTGFQQVPSVPSTIGSGPCGCQPQVTVPACPACTPAPAQACPTCVDLHMYRNY